MRAGILVRLGRILAVVLALAAAPAAAQTERILAFDAQVTVRPDGVLRVVETIEVVAAGQQIRRGIFRDFPTRSITGWGFNHRVGFEVVRVERDGRPEPWFATELAAGLRIYLGSPDVLLERGRHRYTIAYETSRQLLQRPGEDELYWNVTGDAWTFPIERATATVLLPAGTAATAVAGYTGPRGWQGTDFQVLQRDGGTLRLATTRTLAPGEGFTIAAAWPEGAVARPTAGGERLAFIAANRGILIGWALAVVLIVFFGVAWHRVGRDPPKGTVIPLFEAPDRLSPVATGYLWNRGFGGSFGIHLALTVAITSLASRRAVDIEDEGDGEFVVEKRGKPPRDLPPGEWAVAAALFGDGRDAVRFGGSYEPRLGAAASRLVQAIGGEYGRAYFRTNRGLWLGGVVIGIAALACSLLVDAGGEDARIMLGVTALFTVAFGTVGCVLLGNAAARLAGGAGTMGLGALASLAGGALCLLPVAGMLAVVADTAAPAALVPGFLPVPVIVAFWHLLAAPTRLGRRTLDAIEGYRLYLSVAESDRLNAAGREPEITAALFERHLPYAMALGVENQWTDKVMARLTASADDPERARRELAPSWYRMRDRSLVSPADLARSLSGGLASAAAVASTRPSSSSGGSSGGGSSGGGGGGGGGGGW